ncbi:hypothetical protein C361_01932 [Cryptococcus neoformans Tu259-1]|uniref:Uncharacterized protein n=1 Tax=Cryptococcus neoformans Tu259-1 TaxID=1230072 RepID=A0A854QK36_CRYNE|nr:hypothetical protein C361_01932 [Cryptococcus neoformans var. grubii Tu259-1]
MHVTKMGQRLTSYTCRPPQPRDAPGHRA